MKAARRVLAVLSAFAVLAGTPAHGQDVAQSWRDLAKLPNWTDGTWVLTGMYNPTRTNEPVPLKPEYMPALEKARTINRAGGDLPSATYHCVPNGMPLAMGSPQGLYEFLFVPGMVLILTEKEDVRRIYTDGRLHPGILAKTFLGHSIGHWEGETLVVDTAGLRPELQMFYGFVGAGDMHIVERDRQTDPDTMHFDTAITDSALTAPLRYTRVMKRHREFHMREDICAQNNRDVNAITGMQQFNLTPPPPGLY